MKSSPLTKEKHRLRAFPENKWLLRQAQDEAGYPPGPSPWLRSVKTKSRNSGFEYYQNRTDPKAAFSQSQPKRQNKFL